MSSAYSAVEALWPCFWAGDKAALARGIAELLSRHGIRIRQRDGELWQITLSRPTSMEDGYVIGLRYVKLDGTHTEDHFLCPRNPLPGHREIFPYYTGKLETVLSEYRGTHKKQVLFTLATEMGTDITQVNTVSVTKG